MNTIESIKKHVYSHPLNAYIEEYYQNLVSAQERKKKINAFVCLFSSLNILIKNSHSKRGSLILYTKTLDLIKELAKIIPEEIFKKYESLLDESYEDNRMRQIEEVLLKKKIDKPRLFPF